MNDIDRLDERITKFSTAILRRIGALDDLVAKHARVVNAHSESLEVLEAAAARPESSESDATAPDAQTVQTATESAQRPTGENVQERAWQMFDRWDTTGYIDKGDINWLFGHVLTINPESDATDTEHRPPPTNPNTPRSA